MEGMGELAPTPVGVETPPAGIEVAQPEVAADDKAEYNISAAPDGAAQPVHAEAEPEWIDVPDESGQPYTRVRKDKLPGVILAKDRYASELARERDMLREMVLRSQQGVAAGPAAEPAKPSESKWSARAKELLKANGYAEDEAFAGVIGSLLEEAQTGLVQTIQSQQQQQQMQAWDAEYQSLAAADPTFDAATNEIAEIVMTHAALNKVPPAKAYQRFLAMTGRAGQPAPALTPETAGAVRDRAAAAARGASIAPVAGGTPAMPGSAGSGTLMLNQRQREAVEDYRRRNPSATEADIRWVANYAAKTL